MSNRGAAEQIVIIGGGAAAHRCIGAYREAGGTGSLTMISADDRLPYFRPHLTKELMTGDIDIDAIGLDRADWYVEHEVGTRLCETITAIELGTRTIATDHGAIEYDSLVLATGSSAKSLPVPGAELGRLSSIRSAADALAVIDAAADGGPFVVVGSGFIGCEVASSLRARGLEVSMVSTEPSPQQARLGEEASSFIGGWLRDAGIALRGGISVESIEGSAASPSAVVVHLSDGSAMEAAHVVVASGARPNIELAEAAGLPIDGGVIVDASMRTDAPGVYAVGDVAFADNEAARRRLRVEHWGDAEEMGRVVGAVLAGVPAAWNNVPGFWSTITGRELKYSAWGDGWDECRTERSANGGFTIWYGREGVTVGLLTFDHDDDVEPGRALVRASTPFPPG